MRAVDDMQPVGQLALRVALLEPCGERRALRRGASENLPVDVVELAYLVRTLNFIRNQLSSNTRLDLFVVAGLHGRG